MSFEIGKVLGTADSQPLEFWVAVPPDALVQLDEVVLVRRSLSDGKVISIFGIVDVLVARHEGAKLETDVFLACQILLGISLQQTRNVELKFFLRQLLLQMEPHKIPQI